LEDLRVPTIVLINFKGYNHFVVLKRIQGDTVYIADPALGNRHYSLSEFKQQWSSKVVFAVIGPAFDRETPLLQTSVKQVQGLSEPLMRVPRSQLLEFGFSNADLF
jgi:predicted double-glycine peptidase